MALIVNDSIGNFVVATPLMQRIHSDWQPSHLCLVGGVRTELFQKASCLIDSSVNLFGVPVEQSMERIAELSGQFDVVINLENSCLAKVAATTLASSRGQVVGHCLGPDGRGDLEPSADELGDFLRHSNWLDPNILEHCPSLKSNFIGEFFVRMCGFDGEVPRYQLPWEDVSEPVPDVLISTSASLRTKLWPVESWIEISTRLKDRGLTLGVVGAAKDQSQSWVGMCAEDELVMAGLVTDFRGRWNLLQTVGALKKAKLALCIDNGIGHIAAAVSCKNVVLYRDLIHRLWCPPYRECHPAIPAHGASVASITVDQVLRLALSVLNEESIE